MNGLVDLPAQQDLKTISHAMKTRHNTNPKSETRV